MLYCELRLGWLMVMVAGYCHAQRSHSLDYTECFTDEKLPGVCRHKHEILFNFQCSGQCANGKLCCTLDNSLNFIVGQFGGLSPAPPYRHHDQQLQLPITTDDLQQLEREQLQLLQQLSRQQPARVNVLSGDKASLSHRRLQRPTQASVRKMSQTRVVLEAAKILAEKKNLTKAEAADSLFHVSLRNTSLEEACLEQLVCVDSPFRRIDGRCNNLKHGYWGSSDTAYLRISAPDYADGITEPRRASDGSELPSSRLVSSTISPNGTHSQHPSLSLMVMQWGQFLDHDLTLTPMIENDNGSPIRCCNYGFKLPEENLSPDCYPINLPANDAVYGKFFERCMEFVRSVFVASEECQLGPRQQVNQLTAYIDAGNVYGSLRQDDEDYIELRAFHNGLLQYQNEGNETLLPPYIFTCVNATNSNHQCFKAGDERVNEQINLAVLHTMWLREHNRLAGRLATLNPHWHDERIYQESRRIVAALHQHITYEEFLPVILGREYVEKVDVLRPNKAGLTHYYNSELNAAISNEFAAAAYRFGHTLVPDNIVMVHGANAGAHETEMPLHKMQIAPFEMYRKNGYRDLMRGLVKMPSMDYDTEFTSEITDKLFQFESLYGMDLLALNVQRGRDHGIGSYNAVRRACNLPPLKTFKDLYQYMTPKSASRLEMVYRSVADIDLYVAGVSELPLPGALVGPTFHCVLADQFIRLRVGDRYFYEEGGQTGSFSLDQLTQIRRIRLSNVICNNGMDMVQPNVFLQPDNESNKPYRCNDPAMAVDLDLSYWQEDAAATAAATTHYTVNTNRLL